jgi:4-amino-4-deoxy-L-arabinose transferase-like glycosyltransferase
MTTALQEIQEEENSTTIRTRHRRHIFAVAALLGIAAVAFFFGLGRLSLVGPDEPRFAEAAREMFATGDYITPRVAGEAAFDKPALLYWAIAGAFRIFGVNEFAARLPSALAALVCVMFLYHAIARTLSERLAWVAAIVLTTNFFFIGLSRAVIMDMTFTATVTVALLCIYLCSTTVGRARLLYWTIAAATTGMSVLAKGLIGIALIAGITIIAYALTRQPRGLSWRAWITGFVIFLAVVALWYVPVTLVNGHAFIDEFIIKHHFRRFLTNRYQHPQPLWFFPAITLAGLMPWTFFLLPATARLRRIKPRSGEPKDTLLTLAWIWLLVPLIFFSISQSKLPSYILPAFPALAIIVGFEIERFWRGERDRWLAAAAWLTALSVIAFAVALPVYLHREGLLAFNTDAVFYVAPVILAILTAAMMVMNKRRLVITDVAATVLTLVIGATIVLLPHLDDEIGLKRLSLTVAGELRPGEKMTFYQNKNYAPIFYAAGRAVTSPERGEGLNSFELEEVVTALESEASLIVITTASNQALFTDNSLFDAEMIAQQGNHRALRVRLARRDDASETTN